MTADGCALAVDEVPFETWLIAAWRFERVPRRAMRRAASRLAAAPARRLAGARPLYWVWLGSALLALALS
jgi:hypothetical protein